jgi:hypothetical protein
MEQDSALLAQDRGVMLGIGKNVVLRQDKSVVMGQVKNAAPE